MLDVAGRHHPALEVLHGLWRQARFPAAAPASNALLWALGLRENRALTTLDLWRNGITSDGMQALAAALQVPAV